MKKIIEIYNGFKYKTISAIVLLIISHLLFVFTDYDVFSYISMLFFSYLVFSIFKLIFHAIKNTYVIDGEKTKAIIYGIVAVLFVLLTSFILIVNVLFPGNN